MTNLSNGNTSPFIAVNCQTVRTAYDPNDKTAQPTGFDVNHYVYPHDTLDYKIRFQNTGNDTAFLVVIRDTLSAYLDITSLEMGASSHPYTWRVYGQGILEVTFRDIMLPDSNVNEPASHGFFRYRIDQVNNKTIHWARLFTILQGFILILTRLLSQIQPSIPSDCAKTIQN